MAMEIKIEGYDSFEQIAVGGMAAVYKARKISIDKIVAIKVLFPYLAADESFIERFQREAKSAAKVQHENIVNVVDFGESGGSYFIVMEFYEGLTVADLLKEQSRIPLDIGVSLLLDVSLGLEAAHALDIVHRDIKPANIIYTYSGNIKIADFGLAKKSDSMTVVTQAGKVLGTPAYMSPEQAAGKSVTIQSDIFSLGVVAYELFCQRRPFEGNSYSEVLEKIQTQEIPTITQENPLIQPDFENIIRKMLAKDLASRYQTMGEVIADIEKGMEKFEIKRDRRRLRRYISDPATYEEAFKEKMLAKCLSQGAYYMQQGKTHLEDAMREFKRILYLDPTNERARKNLAKIMSEYRDQDNVTVTLDRESVPGGAPAPAAATKKPKKHKKQQPAKPARRRAALIPILMLGVAGLTAVGWWGWSLLQASGNAVPVLSSPARLTVSEGESVEFSLRAVDSDGDAVRVYAKDLPDGATLTEAGEFKWDVAFDQAGRHALRFYAEDGQGRSQSETIVEVIDKELALDFADPGRQSVRAGSVLNVTLQATGTDGREVEFAAEDPPRGLKIRGDVVTWTPRSNQVGTHRVSIRGGDGIAAAERTLVVEVKPDATVAAVQKGRLDWVLPKLANIYVDDELRVREDTYLSIDLASGKHRIRAELLDGMTVFEEEVDVRGGKQITLDPPKIGYGKLSAYFLGGVGELLLNGKKFKEQPPFTGVVVPASRSTVSCRMFNDSDSRELRVEVKEGLETVIEYEIGSEPVVSQVRYDG